MFKDKSLRGETSRDSPELGLDVHQATIVVAVTDSTGKLIMESILETEAATILQFFAGLRGTLAVTFEEGTWSAWLYVGFLRFVELSLMDIAVAWAQAAPAQRQTVQTLLFEEAD